VVLDPLVSFIGRIDPWKDSKVRQVLDPLNAIAAKHSVTILGIMHPTKDKERQLLYRTSGSVAFVAAARSVYAAVRDPQDPSRGILGCLKLNNAKKPPAIAYRIEDSGVLLDGDPVGRVKWEEELSVPFEEITARLDDKSGSTAKDSVASKEVQGMMIIRAVL